MKISSEHPVADAKEKRRQGELAFTMVEIAIAIGVIGFALVAIIGILPAGMNTQKDNREDTTIGQDAPYFMDAIRNGCPINQNYAAQGLDFLTNYVESIVYISNYNGATVYRRTNLFFTNGAQIVGLLSTPQSVINNTPTPTNYTLMRAIVRSLSGAATQQNGSNSQMAFRYQMDVEVVPFNSFAPMTTNYLYYQTAPNVDTNLAAQCYNRWLEATPGANSLPGTGGLAFSLFELRLRFSWPVITVTTTNAIVGGGIIKPTAA